MLTTVQFILLALVVVALVLQTALYRKATRNSSAALGSRLEAFEKAQDRTERMVKEEIALNRGELGKAASEARAESLTAATQLRLEVVRTLTEISDGSARTLKDLAAAEKLQLDAFS
jgi:hypothetical protein